jgi:Na+/H+-dicarboxylate symporter
MCSSTQNLALKKLTPLWYTLAIILGILSGYSDLSVLHTLSSHLSTLVLKVFKCLSLPLISLALIQTLMSPLILKEERGLGRKTLFYTLLTTLLASLVACLLYLTFRPTPVFEKGVLSSDFATHIDKGNGFWNHLLNIVPSHIFEPFLTHNVFGMLLLSVAIGLGIRGLGPSEEQQTLQRVIRGLHSILMYLTKKVILFIPVAIYAFVTLTILEFKTGQDFKGLQTYLLLVIGANIIQGFVILPLLLKSHGIKPFQTLKQSFPALSLAFFSKSSAGTLPLTLECAQSRLGIKPFVARFVLPLCTTINMNGCAAFILITVAFVSESHGIVMEPSTLFLWIFISTLAAVGNAGVPMGCFFLSASLLAGMGIPLHLMGLILPFYALVDMVETSLNVWSDLCVTKMIDAKIPTLSKNDPL